MHVVSGSCQHYKNGAVSNQLMEVGRLGVFVMVRACQFTVYRSTVNHKSLVVSLTYTATLYMQGSIQIRHNLDFSPNLFSMMGSHCPCGRGRGARAKYDDIKKPWTSTDKWVSWHWFSSEKGITKIINNTNE
jgi:hypothetical protein